MRKFSPCSFISLLHFVPENWKRDRINGTFELEQSEESSWKLSENNVAVRKQRKVRRTKSIIIFCYKFVYLVKTVYIKSKKCLNEHEEFALFHVRALSCDNDVFWTSFIYIPQQLLGSVSAYVGSISFCKEFYEAS